MPASTFSFGFILIYFQGVLRLAVDNEVDEKVQSAATTDEGAEHQTEYR